jgi:hypothetical protein
VYSPAQLNDVSLCGSFPSYRNPVEVRVQATSGGLDLKYVGPLGHFAATINNMPANGELALVWVYCTPGARPTRGSYVQLHTGLNVFSV